jgi:hypothetical protein
MAIKQIIFLLLVATIMSSVIDASFQKDTVAPATLEELKEQVGIKLRKLGKCIKDFGVQSSPLTLIIEDFK